MRGQLLVSNTNFENVSGDYLDIYINNVISKRFYLTSYNLYSCPLSVGDVVRLEFSDTGFANLLILNLVRRDYTTDDQGGNNGIVDTNVASNVPYLTYTFTASTVNSAYDFEYRLENTSVFPTPFPTATPSPTPEPSPTPSPSPSPSPTPSPTASATPTPTPTMTGTATPTPTMTNTPTPTPTINVNCFDIGTGFFDSVGTNSYPIIIGTQSDNKIIIANAFLTDYDGTDITSKFTIRLNSDGTYDNTFNTTDSNLANNGKILSDDKMYLGGTFTSYSGQTKYRNIVKLNSNGSIDTSFSPTTGFEAFRISGTRYTSNVRTIDTQSDGKIICGGNFTKYDNVNHYYLVRLTTGGTIDNTFNEGFTTNIDIPASGVQDIKVLSNDKIIVVASNAYQYSGITGGTPQVIRLNSNGTIDNTFNYGSSTVTGIEDGRGSITELSDGKLIITGKWSDYNSSTRYGITKLNSDGSVDSSFNIIPITGGTPTEIENINVQSDGKIICVGRFTNTSGSSTNYIVRLNSDGTYDNTFNLGTGFTNSVDIRTISIKNQTTGKLLITGRFNGYNGTTSNYIIRLDSNGTSDNC